MLNKSMFLSIQILMILGLLLTSCEIENSTELATVGDNPLRLNKQESYKENSRASFVGISNGSFEEPQLANHALANLLNGWTATSNDCRVTHDFYIPPMFKVVYFKGASKGGDNVADAICSDWIKVNPGYRYRLSGMLFRYNSQDNVYLDFNDGIGIGGNFNDVHVSTNGLGQWDVRSEEIYIPSNITHVKVRCVRDGANIDNGMFDEILLQQITF